MGLQCNYQVMVPVRGVYVLGQVVAVRDLPETPAGQRWARVLYTSPWRGVQCVGWFRLDQVIFPPTHRAA